MRNPGSRVLTEQDLQAGEDLGWRFVKGETLTETDLKFSELCKHARNLKAKEGRNPTIDEARAEMADADFVLTVHGTADDARARAAQWQLDIVPVIEVPAINMVVMLAPCGVHPHVVAATCYGWHCSREKEAGPGDLAHFETVGEAVKRRPEMAQVIAAARGR